MNNLSFQSQQKNLPETASMKCRKQRCASFGLFFVLLAGLFGVDQSRADIIPPKNFAVTPGGLNVADGSLTYSVTDLAIGTMKLERSHRTGGASAQPNNPVFGSNFSSNFDIRTLSACTVPASTGAPRTSRWNTSTAKPWIVP